MSETLAYEHNGRRVSRERFYAIACDPLRSVAVEACAGAGKTWMLVSRILRALLAGAQPQEILAITFTKKAAGEMRERLQDWLARFAASGDEDLVKELAARGVADAGPEAIAALRGLYARLLGSGRPVQIRTFHSWFAALLRNAPLAVLEELHLPAHYELLEDDTEAIDLVWRPFHAAVVRDAALRADFEASVAAHGRFNTQKALLAALSKRVEFALADAQGTVEKSVKRFGEQFPEFGGVEEPCHLIEREGTVRDLLLAAASALGRASQPSFSAKGAELEGAVSRGDLQGAFDALLTQKGEQRKFSDKIAGIERVRLAQELTLRINAACAQHAAWLHHGRMVRLARVLIQEFSALKRERGWIDMNDVERAALAMLSDPVLSGWVQERLDARTRHLLIDEFQDTNPLQWQALHGWLQSYAGSGGNAPSVFIVGDPKQSIYRFRRAEPQVFMAAQRFIAQGLGGDQLSCDHTHRNAPEIIAVVNQVMGAAQAADEYEGFRSHTTQADHHGLTGALPRIARASLADGTGREQAGLPDAPTASAALAWRDSLTVPRDLAEEKLVTLESRQAAAWVASLIAQGTPPEHIMVLARKRDRLAAMEDELRALHIPSQQPEKSDLADAPEVQDIIALLDVLVSPTHDLSLARALKSPLFGLGDEVLVELALAAREARAADQPTTWFDLVLARREQEGALGDAARKLGAWQKLIGRWPPHDVLDAIYAQGDVLARFGAAAPPPLRELMLARLRAVLAAALQVNGGRYATPYAFVRALKAGGIPAPTFAKTQAVRLLTVHGAKGLEAPIVLLLDTDAPAARAESMAVVVEWPGEAPVPRRFAFIASESRPPPCSAQALEVERAARQREELNALYVAMTRAREQLVISCVEPYISNPGSWWERLHALCPPLDAMRTEGRAADTGGMAGLAVDSFTLCELPVLKQRQEKTSEEAAHADSEASRFGQAVHRLLELWRPGITRLPAEHMRRIAREFALDDARTVAAATMAQRIIEGEVSWAWDTALVDWHGNEVPIHHAGEPLRIDRLVRHAATGEWWVLDYKSNFRPEKQEELLAQMRRYHAAVSAANPGATVRAAFVTGEGKLVLVA